MNVPDNQTTIQFNKASVSLMLKFRIVTIILAFLFMLWGIFLFILYRDIDLLGIPIVSAFLGYFLLKQYLFWRKVLRNSKPLQH